MSNTFKRVVRISKERHDCLQDILDIEEGYCKDYRGIETIATFTADFGNGIEADIKVCNGDTPFVDSVLFDNGVQVTVLDVGETLLGEYCFEYNGNEYVVIIELE